MTVLAQVARVAIQLSTFTGSRKEKNDTHTSRTDSDGRVYKKAEGQQARLYYMGHTLTENRNGLLVDATVTITSGTAERDAAEMMLDQIPSRHRITQVPTRDMIAKILSKTAGRPLKLQSIKISKNVFCTKYLKPSV